MKRLCHENWWERPLIFDKATSSIAFLSLASNKTLYLMKPSFIWQLANVMSVLLLVEYRFQWSQEVFRRQDVVLSLREVCQRGQEERTKGAKRKELRDDLEVCHSLHWLHHRLPSVQVWIRNWVCRLLEVYGSGDYKNQLHNQGCISCGILVSGIRARGVSSEHMENMEMFSCSPT